MLDAVVAVKIMPFKEKASWLAEQEIYNLPHMKHDNILLFVGGEKHEENLWLITEFHEKGSLCDFLKGNSVTWSQLCKIAESMVRGMPICFCYFLVRYCEVSWSDSMHMYLLDQKREKGLYYKSYPYCLWTCSGCCGTTVKTADITYNGSCMGIPFNTDLHLIL